MAISALRLEEQAMPWFDLPEEQLKEYRTDTAERPAWTSGGGCGWMRPARRRASRS